MFDATELGEAIGKKIGDALDEQIDSEIMDVIVGKTLIVIGELVNATFTTAGEEMLNDSDAEEEEDETEAE